MKKTISTQAIELTLLENYLSQKKNDDNNGIIAGNRKALNEERVRLIKELENFTTIQTTLRRVVSALPTGEEHKASKQSWKRSISLAFGKVFEGHVLTFKVNVPVISEKEAVSKASDIDKAFDVLAGYIDEGQAKDLRGVFAKMVKTTEKETEELSARLKRIEEEEKAKRIESLQNMLAELQKEALPIQKVV